MWTVEEEKKKKGGGGGRCCQSAKLPSSNPNSDVRQFVNETNTQTHHAY